MANNKTVYLKDYQKSNYNIKNVDLTFNIYEKHVSVTSKLEVEKVNNSAHELTLYGKELQLQEIIINNEKLTELQYSVDSETLTIKSVPNNFTLEIVVHIDPFNNTSLEGLYKSENILCTQNEPIGFRKITYFLDRPDVMSIYKVRLTGDKNIYPYLLSNGNRVNEGDLEGNRHFVDWIDPFPKPSYLFAIVAGDFDVARDHFTTMRDREVKLEIYVEKGKLDRVEHAMLSLKHSMKWDEDRFGLECDLDEYKIVAVDSFNMGAMENKGLNVFNTSCTLGNTTSATDTQLQRIEEVIAHEYFHNWTGNRVTCRDWFQLTLKEGLTVFRDHEFSADMRDEVVQRIDSVTALRAVQFPEDSGPLSHPIRPSSYKQIDNFYTSTVYEKGQEIIRMIQTYIGKDKFRKGIDKYFELYDGQAVTTEDFIYAMELASGKSLDKFKNWYNQSGTPICNVTSDFDKQAKTYTLTVTQEKAKNINVDQKPFQFPIKVALFSKCGKQMTLNESNDQEVILDIYDEAQTFTFKNIRSKPIPSLLRMYSAPVILNYKYKESHLLFLFKNDTDGFNRYEAGQRLAFKIIKKLIDNPEYQISTEVLDCYKSVLIDDTLDYKLRSKMISLPTLSTILELLDEYKIDETNFAREILLKSIVEHCEKELLETYTELSKDKFEITNSAMSRRALKNSCLAYLCLASEKYCELANKQYFETENMTDTIASLVAVNNSENKEIVHTLFDNFYSKWIDDQLVINNWLVIQASRKSDNLLELVKSLTETDAFDYSIPNKVYSLLLVFTANLPYFHAKDGSGYKYIADMMIKMDDINCHVASKLAKTFKKYPDLDSSRKGLMKAELERVIKKDNCSKVLSEIVELIINS